jgi:hypothetical protein
MLRDKALKIRALNATVRFSKMTEKRHESIDRVVERWPLQIKLEKVPKSTSFRHVAAGAPLPDLINCHGTLPPTSESFGLPQVRVLIDDP